MDNILKQINYGYICIDTSVNALINIASDELKYSGTSCKEKFRKNNFQTGFVVARGEFLSYLKLISLKRRSKRFGF